MRHQAGNMAIGGVVGTVLVLTATSGSATLATGESGWEYTDGSGKTVTLDEVPTNIVMNASAAAGLIPLGIRPVAIYADQPVNSDPQLRGLDLDGIDIVGETWGEINIEAVAALEPDLIVSEWWPLEEAYSGMEEGTGGANAAMFEIAPVVGVAQGPSVVQMIRDYEELASSLGADLDDPEVAGRRADFEATVERFQEAVAAKPGLTVLAVSPTPESLYVAVPGESAELSDFVSWGLDVVDPEPDPGFPYWETLSWELAGKYPADLIIVDNRTGTAALEDAEAQPMWQTLPAVQAGAVAMWPAFWLRNYAAYTGELDALTDAVAAADPDLV